MNWLSDLLKHISPAKPLIVSLFLAALVAIVGSRLWPDVFNFSVPTQWFWLVWFVGLVSLFLILSWLVEPVKNSVFKLFRWALWSPTLHRLKEDERTLLIAIASRDPFDYVMIEWISPQRGNWLHILNLCRKLEKRGLVDLDSILQDRVMLTEQGQSLAGKFVQEIQAGKGA